MRGKTFENGVAENGMLMNLETGYNRMQCEPLRDRLQALFVMQQECSFEFKDLKAVGEVALQFMLYVVVASMSCGTSREILAPRGHFRRHDKVVLKVLFNICGLLGVKSHDATH